MSTQSSDMRRLGPGLFMLAFCIGLLMILPACGSSGDAEESAALDVGISVSAGTFTTTVRVDGVTQLPFAETLLVEVEFEEAIYGAAGQTAVFAQATPNAYRITSRPPRNSKTFTFAMSNRSPGTVEVSIFANRDAVPVVFTLEVGAQQ